MNFQLELLAKIVNGHLYLEGKRSVITARLATKQPRRDSEQSRSGTSARSVTDGSSPLSVERKERW
jgi:hypothetical protein